MQYWRILLEYVTYVICCVHLFKKCSFNIYQYVRLDVMVNCRISLGSWSLHAMFTLVIGYIIRWSGHCLDSKDTVWRRLWIVPHWCSKIQLWYLTFFLKSSHAENGPWLRNQNIMKMIIVNFILPYYFILFF